MKDYEIGQSGKS